MKEAEEEEDDRKKNKKVKMGNKFLCAPSHSVIVFMP